MVKVHRVLFKAVAETLSQIFDEGWLADKAVENCLRQNPGWGSRDRKFIAGYTYDIVRWWRLVNYLAGEDRTGDYFFLAGTWFAFVNDAIPEWPEFRAIHPPSVRERYNALKGERRVVESVPDWLDELAVREMGELTWEKEIHALNEKAPVVLRVNTLKGTIKATRQQLKAEGVETTTDPKYPDALFLDKRQSLAQLPSYKNGLVEVQDASSQLVAAFLGPEPGMHVIDACAGAGGKSLHIAALMKNTGSLLSMDVEERKLTELQRRASRAGAKIIKTKVVSMSVAESLEGTCDRLLLDVPCSGLGVLRRNPDSKWKLSPDFMDAIRSMQAEILAGYSQMLKPGGEMVYATCSILPSENNLQVEKFLALNQNFELLAEERIMPSEGFDGFYMARLKRIS